MKKLVVISDNHGDQEILTYIKEKEHDADAFIHLGDSEAFDENVLEGMIAVSGNNDWAIDLPKCLSIQVDSFKILILHGQNFGYFDRMMTMDSLLELNDCNVMFSGHTHMPMFEFYNDKYFINPGSTSWPRGGSAASYCIVRIEGDKLECEHILL